MDWNLTGWDWSNTFKAKGSPELTVVWMDVEGDELLFNTAEERRKPTTYGAIRV